MVKDAKAQAKSKKLQGKGIVDQRKAIIDGFKENINKMNEIEGVNSQEISHLILITQYFDTLKDAVQSDSNTLILPNNPSGFTDIRSYVNANVINKKI